MAVSDCQKQSVCGHCQLWLHQGSARWPGGRDSPPEGRAAQPGMRWPSDKPSVLLLEYPLCSVLLNTKCNLNYAIREVSVGVAVLLTLGGLLDTHCGSVVSPEGGKNEGLGALTGTQSPH